jgi:hypothetical protein
MNVKRRLKVFCILLKSSFRQCFMQFKNFLLQLSLKDSVAECHSFCIFSFHIDIHKNTFIHLIRRDPWVSSSLSLSFAERSPFSKDS